MKKAIVLSVVVLVIAIGLLYIEFKNNPVKKMDVLDGVVIGEKGFLGARSAALSCICMSWVTVFAVVFLKISTKGKTTPETQRQTKPTGWYSDPNGRHELRYWNGSAWTEQVSDQGQKTIDPPGDQL